MSKWLKKKCINADVQYCMCCNINYVEDEFHFLMICPVYIHLRNQLVIEVNNQIIQSNVSVEEKQLILSDPHAIFKYIMQSNHESIIDLLSSYLSEAFKLREQMLTP